MEYLANTQLRATPLRKTVHALFKKENRSLKAYEIMDLLSTKSKKVRAPIIYRVLEDFHQNGIIHRIEKHNSYVLCEHSHEEKEHIGGIQIICENCGGFSEIVDKDLYKKVLLFAKQKNFFLKTTVFELHGLCLQCQTTTN